MRVLYNSECRVLLKIRVLHAPAFGKKRGEPRGSPHRLLELSYFYSELLAFVGAEPSSV